MILEEKKRLMARVYKTLTTENYSYMKMGFDTVARVREKNYSFEISVSDNGKYLLTSGNGFMTLTFENTSDLFDTIFFMYHCMNENK